MAEKNLHEVPPQGLRLGDLDMDAAIEREKDYKDELDRLQEVMLRVQQTYYHEKRRAIVVFEGWDAGGKGGAIRRLTQPLDPRGFRVWPIAAPRPDEQARHYLYRFWQKIPEPGTIAIFDRSWYGRVLVERVQKFAADSEWQRAYDEINEFERLLADDGVRIVKLFMHITPEEQLARFAERLSNPVKRWKITEDDIRNRARWADYEAAIEEMFARTSTSRIPWHAIPANHKWYARLSTARVVTERLGAGLTLDPPPLDMNVRKLALEQLGIETRKANGKAGKRD